MAQNPQKRDDTIQNFFNKGMFKDSLNSLMPDGYYKEAWGAVVETQEENNFGISNESSTELCATLPRNGVLRGYYYIEERDWHVVFFVDQNGKSEIGYIDNNKCEYIKIYDDCDMCFSMKEWIPITAKVMQPCNEVHLYWSNNDFYYRLNIDNLTTIKECEDLLLFQCKCLPTVEATVTEKGGNDLEAGAYQFVAQLTDDDGNDTNWFNISNAVYLGSENNRGGDRSEQAIHLEINNVTEQYTRINIAAIKTINGAKTAVLIAEVPYSKNGVSFFYRSKGQELGTVPLAEILSKNPGYIRGSDLVQYDGRLFLYNVRGERNLDLQERVNQMRFKYKIGRVPMKYAHLFSGFRHDEVYDISINANFCDGRKTRAFHAPGKGGTTEGLGCNDCNNPNDLNNASRTNEFTNNADEYEKEIIKNPDEYDPFIPTDQDILGDDDFATPNLDPIREALEGEGDNCCEILAATVNRRVLAAVIRIFREGIDIFTPSKDELERFKLALDIYSQLCECGLLTVNADEGGLTPQQQEIEDAINSGDLTSLTDEQIEIFLDDFDFNRRNNSSLDSRSGDSQEGPCYPESDDDGCIIVQGEQGQQGQGLSSRGDDPGGPGDEDPCDDNGAYPGNPNGETQNTNDPICDEDVSAGGETPTETGGVQSDNESKPDTRQNGTIGGTTGTGRVNLTDNDCEPTVIYEDEDCCVVKEIIPCIDAEGELSSWESCELYPETTKCCGEGLLYGDLAGTPIRYHKMPSISVEPHFISYQDGVPTTYNKDNYEGNNTYARFIWLEIENLPKVSDDELDVPLCPENPWTINVRKRDLGDKSVIASGPLFGTFKGDVFGETNLYPNVGVNSPTIVDRHINNDGRRLGEINDEVAAYTFHSPDIHFDRPSLNPDYVTFDLDINGKGFRHGLYGEGVDPESPFVARCHRKGARSSVNLNHYDTRGDNSCVKAISYAPADSVVDKSDEFTYNLVNLNRESSVYLETEGGPTITPDTSFSREVEQHQEFLTGNSIYTTLKRNIPNQYGNVVDASYFPLQQVSALDVQNDKVLVKAGDSFINLFSFKRTSYVSDLVGSDISPALEFGGGFTSTFILKNLLKRFLNTIGAEECGTVPQSGNSQRDPRSNNAINGRGTIDAYFPQVQTTLISVPVESDVNLGFRGSGDSFATSTYRDLNGQNLDSSFDGGNGAYENSWLDRFGAEMKEMPKWKLILRIIFNFLFTYGIGIALIVLGVITLNRIFSEAVVGLVNSVLIIFAAVGAIALILLGTYWIIRWVNTDLDNRFIDNFLGITDCFSDFRLNTPRGVVYKMRDSRVQGFEDNYYEYNYDFSEINCVERVLGLPDPYNLCDCLNEKTYQVLYSERQDPTSWIDAYRNFKTNNYTEIEKSSGFITNMFVRGNRMFAHTTDMIKDLRSNSTTLRTTSEEDVFLGRGDVLQKSYGIYQGPVEGHAGLLDPNASISSKWGQIFIDREARKIYLFNGNGQLEELTTPTMRNFLRENLYFELLEQFPDFALVDERSPNGIGYSLGVDHRHDRLLITKIDYKPKEDVNLQLTEDKCGFIVNGNAVTLGDPRYFYNRSWTLSYSFLIRNFVSFHWYQPLSYFWNRHEMFSISGSGFWKHNQNHNYQCFYGEHKPFIVEYIARNKNLDSFEYQNTTIDSEIYRWDECDYVRDFRETFQQVELYNSYQTTGLKDLIDRETLDVVTAASDDSRYIPLNFIKRRYRFGEVFNQWEGINNRMFDCPGDFGPKIINSSLLTDQTLESSFVDNYLAYRFWYENPDKDKKLILKLTTTHVKEETL